MMITPSTIKNTTSTIKISGIFDVGFTNSMISQFISSLLKFEMTKRVDLGMMGDHYR